MLTLEKSKLKTENKMSIYKKLFEAKKEIGKISKDSTNPFYKSKYFDINSLLEHVEPILQKHKLLLTQPIQNGKVLTLITDIEFEEESVFVGNVVSEIELPEIQDPQKLGSAITYYRRYTLQSLLGLQAEDDDANLASKKTQSIPIPTPKRLTPAQVKSIPTSEVLESLLKVQATYSLSTDEKAMVQKRINELKAK
jgi:hypothetical protein